MWVRGFQQTATRCSSSLSMRFSRGVWLHRLVQPRRQRVGIVPFQPAALRLFRLPQHLAKLQQGRDILFVGQRIGEKVAPDRAGVAGPLERPFSGGVRRQNVSVAGRLPVQSHWTGSIVGSEQPPPEVGTFGRQPVHRFADDPIHEAHVSLSGSRPSRRSSESSNSNDLVGCPSLSSAGQDSSIRCRNASRCSGRLSCRFFSLRRSRIASM